VVRKDSSTRLRFRLSFLEVSVRRTVGKHASRLFFSGSGSSTGRLRSLERSFAGVCVYCTEGRKKLKTLKTMGLRFVNCCLKVMIRLSTITVSIPYRHDKRFGDFGYTFCILEYFTTNGQRRRITFTESLIIRVVFHSEI
jgi:hypothetical protein